MTSARSSRSPEARRPVDAGGFTLIEMMVTIAVLGMALSLVFNYDAVLPQARLLGSATSLQTAVRTMRSHALMTQREVVFVYHLDDNSFEAWYPVERDDDGETMGPGKTPVLDLQTLEEGIALHSVHLADRSERVDGDVEFRISRLGRMAPHRVLVVNPEFPEMERRWLVVDGLLNDGVILEQEDLSRREEVTDASFR